MSTTKNDLGEQAMRIAHELMEAAHPAWRELEDPTVPLIALGAYLYAANCSAIVVDGFAEYLQYPPAQKASVRFALSKNTHKNK